MDTVTPNPTWLSRIAALIQAWTDAGESVSAAAKALSTAIPQIQSSVQEVADAAKKFQIKVL